MHGLRHASCVSTLGLISSLNRPTGQQLWAQVGLALQKWITQRDQIVMISWMRAAVEGMNKHVKIFVRWQRGETRTSYGAA